MLGVQDDGSGTRLRQAVQTLMALPQVQAAFLNYAMGSSSRRPTDGSGWTRSDWQLNPDSASGQNWALEQVAAPLAWGCEIGSIAAHVTIWDDTFDSTETVSNAIPPLPIFGHPTDTSHHGTSVSSIVAARGNNSKGMTGVMWNAGLSLVRRAAVVPTAAIAQEIVSAGNGGADVLNLSMTIRWTHTPGGQADSTIVENMMSGMWPLLRANSASLPLIVIAAGNSGVADYFGGLPRLEDSFPSSVIVVGSNTQSLQRASSSNFGARISVWAPGEGIYALNASGTPRPVAGTSFAAPLVTGAAGLLKSFDPRLGKATIESLLVAGADSGHRTVTGVGQGTGRLLNIYESLRLAARRPGAPACGFPITTTTSGQLAFYRNPVSPELISTPWPVTGNVSVAQGGKLLVVQNADASGYPFFYQGMWANGSWSWSPLPGNSEGRVFLEYDTVDYYINPNYPSHGSILAANLTGPNRPGSRGPKLTGYDPYWLSSVLNGGQYESGDIEAWHPNGEWVGIAIVRYLNGLNVRSTYLVKTADNSVFKVNEAADGANGDLYPRGWVWTHDGQYFLMNYQPNPSANPPDLSSLYRPTRIQTSGPVILSDFFIGGGNYANDQTQLFSSDDHYLYSDESAGGPFGQCTPERRVFPGFTQPTEVGPTGQSTCLSSSSEPTPVIPNSVVRHRPNPQDSLLLRQHRRPLTISHLSQ